MPTHEREEVEPVATSDHTSPADIPTNVLHVSDVLGEITRELVIQDVKWGEQNHPDGTGGPVMRSEAERHRAACDYLHKVLNAGDWRSILLEEVYEACAEDDPAKLRAELVQVAAVAVQWVLAIDRRGGESR